MELNNNNKNVFNGTGFTEDKTAFNGNGFGSFINDDAQSLVKQFTIRERKRLQERRSFELQKLNKTNFIDLLKKIKFYKNIGSFQSCPKSCFLKEVVDFIEEFNLTFWQVADWMYQYLIENKDNFEEYHEYEHCSKDELLKEIVYAANENLTIIFKG